MFGIGPGELILIFIIALFAFGPERLPGLARDIGRVMGELRKTSDELTQEFLKATEPPKESPSPPAAIESPPAATTPEATGEEPTDFDKKAQEEADRAREQARLGGIRPSTDPLPHEPERWG